MTTFQDPPLQSRRAARQVERNAAYGQQPDEAAEPLTYQTQNRGPLPQYDGPDFRARRTPEAADGAPAQAEQQPETQLLPKQDVPSYRPRDYSPEGRRAAPQADIPPQAAVPRTGAAQVGPAPTAAEPMPQPAAPPVTAAPVEHTMTRRELRALREAQGNAAQAAASAAAPTPEAATPEPEAVIPELVEPVARPTTGVIPTDPALSPFEALFAAPSQQQTPAAEDFAPDPIASVPEPAAPESVVAEPVVVSPVVAEPVAPAPEAPVVEAEVVEAPAAETPTPAPIPSAPVAPAPVTPAAEAPAAEARATTTGHWTTQADLDDATQVNDSTITRSVGAGSGVITTSALVLPSLPNPEYAHLGTGEILVTGSIDLPHSLATSGAHPAQLDEHHLDHELDPGDHQVVSTDSQPVRAIKAVSSHGSTRDVIVAKKPQGNRALTALIISAAAMAAVVVTLLVVGLVSGVL